MTQDEPIMSGSTEASHDSRVAGIVEQVRADMQQRSAQDSQLLLRRRLEEAGIQLSEDEISGLNAEVQNGPSVVD